MQVPLEDRTQEVGETEERKVGERGIIFSQGLPPPPENVEIILFFFIKNFYAG